MDRVINNGADVYHRSQSLFSLNANRMCADLELSASLLFARIKDGMIGGHRDKQMDLLDVVKKSGRGKHRARVETRLLII